MNNAPKTTTTETFAAQLTQAIADGMTEISEDGLNARYEATNRALSFLAWTVGTTDAHTRTDELQTLIFEKLEDTYAADIAANAASAALLGEIAREGISDEDYATLTGRWFSAFDGR